MISEEFLNYLKKAVEIAKSNGFDMIEIIHEDEDVEVFLVKNDAGIGSLRNDLKDDLWKLRKKDIKVLKTKLGVKSVSLKDYTHFLENARKLSIKFF